MAITKMVESDAFDQADNDEVLQRTPEIHVKHLHLKQQGVAKQMGMST